MSHQWAPVDPPMVGLKPGDPVSKLVLWMNNALKSLHEHMHRPPWSIEVSYVAPPKPDDGDLVYADGVRWNPGSGRGLYYYKVNAWVHIA